ncbi:hypothetical protein BDW69DRAFT_100100 [Aspergillus filifer]
MRDFLFSPSPSKELVFISSVTLSSSWSQQPQLWTERFESNSSLSFGPSIPVLLLRPIERNLSLCPRLFVRFHSHRSPSGTFCLSSAAYLIVQPRNKGKNRKWHGKLCTEIASLSCSCTKN